MCTLNVLPRAWVTAAGGQKCKLCVSELDRMVRQRAHEAGRMLVRRQAGNQFRAAWWAALPYGEQAVGAV